MSRGFVRKLVFLFPALLSLVLAESCRSRESRDHAAVEELSLRSLLADVEEVERLRSKRETASLSEQPAADVIALVNQVLSEIGVPTSHFGSLSPEGDVAVTRGGPSLRKQSARLLLNRLTLFDLGEFLQRWTVSQRLWEVSALELTHGRADNDRGRYDVRIVLQALYHKQVPPAGSP